MSAKMKRRLLAVLGLAFTLAAGYAVRHLGDVVAHDRALWQAQPQAVERNR